MAMYFDPFSELDRLTNNLFTRSGPRLMPVDLYREGDKYVLNADLPGIDPGSVDLDVDGQLLTIRAQRTGASAEGAKWLSQERPYGTYLRQFSLGDGIDSENISAHYENGVLSVIIPVSERARPRRIEIESSTGNQAKITASSS
jgi:HSP20 family protein